MTISPSPCRLAVLVALVLGLATPAIATDLAPLGDEFENAVTLSTWQRIHVVEEWNADQLETWDIDVTTPGRMTMMPYTTVWYADWRGPYAFKRLGGDFVATTDVTSTGRDGVSVPSSVYSLGGILIRTPRNITPETWSPGGENYVFLSLGYGTAMPRTFQFEVKTTANSVSNLVLQPAPGPSARLQIARIGSAVITLRSEPGQPWVVHSRYSRPDFPDSMQVGLVTYTDWNKCNPFSPFVHNSTVLDPPLPPGVNDPRPDIPYNPDLISSFEYLRFHRPTVPPALQGRNLANPAEVSNAELLSFLGDAASEPPPASVFSPPRGSGLEMHTSPNPFATRSTIAFRLRDAGEVRLAVFDIAGRRVRELAREPLDAGAHLRVWDGRDEHGDRVAAGLYVVRLASGEESTVSRIVRAR